MTSKKSKSNWIPSDGSTEGRVLLLLNGAKSFWHSRLVNPWFGYTDYKPSSAASVIRKLKDRSFIITKVELYRHDHPLGLDWYLEPGQSIVEVTFCKLLDKDRTPVSFFKWYAPVETPIPMQCLFNA